MRLCIAQEKYYIVNKVEMKYGNKEKEQIVEGKKTQRKIEILGKELKIKSKQLVDYPNHYY